MRRIQLLTVAVMTLLVVRGGAAPVAAADKAQKPATQAKALTPNTPVAEVNGKKITKADYDRALRAIQGNLNQMAGGQGKIALPDSVKKDLVNQLVGRELLYQESLKYQPKDQSKRVDDEIARVKASYPKAESFQERLKKEGVTEKEFRDIVGRELLVRNYVETQIAPKVSVTEADAKKFYEENKAKMAEPEQVRASHVLIRAAKDAKPAEKEQARAKAKEIQKRAAKGEDFAKLATENSQDPGSAKSGGDLGFFPRSRVVEPFANAAFSLKTGQVSDVVETEFGFHVLKVTDRKAAHQQSFDEVKEKLVAFLKNQAMAKSLAAKIEELKKPAKVKILVPDP